MTNLLLNIFNSINIHAHNRKAEADKDFRIQKVVRGKVKYYEHNSKNFEKISKDFVGMFQNVKDKRTAWAILKTKTKEWKKFIQMEMGTEKNYNNNHFVSDNHRLPKHFKEELYKEFFNRHKDDETVKENVSKIWLSAAKNSFHFLFRVPKKPVPDQEEIKNALSFAPEFMDLDDVVKHCVDSDTENHRPIVLRDPDPYEEYNSRPESEENQADVDRSKLDIKYVDYSPLEFLQTHMSTDEIIDSYMLHASQAVKENNIDKFQDNHLFKIFTRRAKYYKTASTQPISYNFLQLTRLMREGKKEQASAMLDIIHENIINLPHHKQVSIGDDADFECMAEHYHKTALEMTAQSGAPVIVQARAVGMDTRIQSRTQFFF